MTNNLADPTRSTPTFLPDIGQASPQSGPRSGSFTTPTGQRTPGAVALLETTRPTRIAKHHVRPRSPRQPLHKTAITDGGGR
ncbi:hypothetical protein [Actinomadura sp. NBRC 104425]|uniref:hypothetical protein n=1 Tax=Actinomadura sp. NBRC 104425 TaxID=3032204 RepID=UPI0025549A68|nr:hypothetical protein [Actinomadura sp. NBRC 104425]